MSLKTILVHLDEADDASARLDAACSLAEAHVAHLNVLALTQQIATYVASGIDAGAGMVDIGQIEDARRKAQAMAADARQRIDARGVLGEARWSSHELFGLREAAGVQGRHADLTITGQPADDVTSALRETVIEGALFSSGRPVLIVPADYKGELTAKHVIVAWDGSKEAARALSDAATFLDRAGKVTIVIVDPKPGMSEVGPEPGADIAVVLSRHCKNVELARIPSGGESIASAILQCARDVNGDLLVMGGYGHSVMRETLFGGVTRDMIAQTTVPLLLSH